MNRIISGEARGRKIKVPPEGTRPTSDRAREGLFSSLQVRFGFVDKRVLDLFAGSGALGLEALSRGAARVAFVDDGAAARALLRANVEKARAMGVTDIWRRDATDLGPNRGAGYDLVFLDPPYALGLGERAIASALASASSRARGRHSEAAEASPRTTTSPSATNRPWRPVRSRSRMSR